MDFSEEGAQQNAQFKPHSIEDVILVYLWNVIAI